jgi:hypothetical protein
MKQFLFLTLVLLWLKLAATQCLNKPLQFTNSLAKGPIQVQYKSCETGFDSPRLASINNTSYDWWYFDAVSEDASQSIVVVFFGSGGNGFNYAVTSARNPISMYIFATFPDGSPLILPIMASHADVWTEGHGASGNWEGSGGSFKGTPDLSQYTVTINNTVLGIQGTMKLKSVCTIRSS